MSIFYRNIRKIKARGCTVKKVVHGVEAGTVSSMLLEERNLNPAVFLSLKTGGKTSVPLSCIP